MLTMKKLALLFLLCLSSAVASAAAKPEKQTLTSEGKERVYYTFVPEKLTAPAPLLLLLHGSGRDGMSQINEWKSLAEKEGLILAAPDSANSREWSMNTDGPEFLHAVVEAVRAKNSGRWKTHLHFWPFRGGGFCVVHGSDGVKVFCRRRRACGRHGRRFLSLSRPGEAQDPDHDLGGDRRPIFFPDRW